MGFFSKNDSPVLSLPPTLYAVSGVPLAVYFRNVIRADHPWDSYGIDVDWTGPVDGLGNDAAQTAHQQQRERWIITPKDADVAAGNVFTSPSPFTLNLYRGGGRVASASATMKIAKSTAGATAYGGQMFLNGQFELPGTHDAAPSWWQLQAGGDGTLTTDTSDKKFGSCSAKLSCTTSWCTIGKAWTNANLVTNGEYKISFWYKGGEVKLDLKYYNASGSYDWATMQQTLPAVADWTYYEKTFQVARFMPRSRILASRSGECPRARCGSIR